jgi:hypothetical protein
VLSHLNSYFTPSSASVAHRFNHELHLRPFPRSPSDWKRQRAQLQRGQDPQKEGALRWIQTGRRGRPSLSVLYGTSLRLRWTHSRGYRYFNIVNSGLETTYMYLANRLVTALFLAGALAISGSSVAAATPQASVQVRVYDSHHHDYHNWDEREDRAYRSYLTKRHEEYHKYSTWHHKEQQNYWNWRHHYPDHD